MKHWMIWIPLTALCMLAGCVASQTGEPILAPGTIETIDAVAAVVEPVGVSLALLFPPAAAIGGILAGVAGAWRKMKPQIEAARSDLDIAEAAGDATACAIEDFKKSSPDEWKVLSDYFKKHHGPTIENFYRALRDLPPKG